MAGLFCLAILLSACGMPVKPAPTETPAIPTCSRTPAPTLTVTRTRTFTPTISPTPSSSPTTTWTATPLPSATATPTPIPTYIQLRGEVIIEQAICHYGPGAPYLYKYGVYKGSNLEILRRIEGGNYVEIQAIGGNNPCWVRVDYFNIKGDPTNLEPVRIEDVRLPISPYYAPPSGVSARRDGNTVTVFWHPLMLRAGDDSEQVPYIVEAVVCQAGQMVFIPAGTYQTALEIIDEPGCSSRSYATFIAAEKHGYTRRVSVPWPAFEFPGMSSPSPTP